MPRKTDAQETALVRLFGSTSRARILQLFLSQKDPTYYQREVMYETGLSLQAVQRELANLVDLGFLQRYLSGQRVYYKIDQKSPLLGPLQELVGD